MAAARQGSLHGVWVNGQRVQRATLADKDVIAIGITILVFRTAREAPTRRVPEGDVLEQLCDELCTVNPALLASAAEARRLAPSTLSLLVHGQTGVGKEVMARAIHRWSGRAGPFVPVNCSAFSEALIASELFGVKKGAFTDANEDRPGLVRSADGGTLFLDEVAELPESCQALLLRVLQDGMVQAVGDTRSVAVDVFVLSATHQNLEELADAGRGRDARYRAPPRRSQRAELPHWAPASGSDAQTLAGVRVQNPRAG